MQVHKWKFFWLSQSENLVVEAQEVQHLKVREVDHLLILRKVSKKYLLLYKLQMNFHHKLCISIMTTWSTKTVIKVNKLTNCGQNWIHSKKRKSPIWTKKTESSQNYNNTKARPKQQKNSAAAAKSNFSLPVIGHQENPDQTNLKIPLKVSKQK